MKDVSHAEPDLVPVWSVPIELHWYLHVRNNTELYNLCQLSLILIVIPSFRNMTRIGTR